MDTFDNFTPEALRQMADKAKGKPVTYENYSRMGTIVNSWVTDGKIFQTIQLDNGVEVTGIAGLSLFNACINTPDTPKS